MSASGPTKKVGYKKLYQFCRRISKTEKCKFYLAGGKSDKDLIDEIKINIGKNALSFEKMRIKETMGYIKKLRFIYW